VSRGADSLWSGDLGQQNYLLRRESFGPTEKVELGILGINQQWAMKVKLSQSQLTRSMVFSMNPYFPIEMIKSTLALYFGCDEEITIWR
jgi:hypothetical protein